MRTQVTLRIEGALLSDADRAARALGLSRNAWFSIAAAQSLGRDAALRELAEIRQRLDRIERRIGGSR